MTNDAFHLRLLTKPSEERDLLTDVVRHAGVSNQPVRVLEAGCGQRWGLNPPGVPLHITGLDTDAEALRIRREERGDLDEEILGDLRSASLPPAAFDLVYCSFVLEHVQGAEAALDRMLAAVRPGGQLVIRVPDGDSVYGFLTKHSPHRVHVLYKRYIERQPNAGKPGHAPYPTVYDDVVTASGLHQWAQRNNLTVVAEYGTDFYLNVFRKLRPVVEFGMRLIAKISFGRLSADHNNIGFVMRKPI